MKRINQNVFTPVNPPKSTGPGVTGYDNPRENIDPHIKTKVVSTQEGSIERTPTNDNHIANKKYVDDTAGGGVDWTVSQAPAVIHADNYTDTNDDTTAHASFTQLDYASAGHTGFEPAKGADDNFVTDAQLVVIGNTSGANTGDQDISGIALNAGSLVTNTTAIALNAGSLVTHASNISLNSGSLVTNTAAIALNTGSVALNTGSLVTNTAAIALNTGSAHTQGTDTTLGANCVAADHGTATTDMVINACYGTGSTPPAANTTTIGTLYIQYTA